MNAAQIHLALNHAPLMLSLVGGILLAWGILRKNDSVQSLSLYLLVISGLLTIPVYLSGEGTEELVERIPGVGESLIERHEDMAKIALVLISVTGILSLVAILAKKSTALSRRMSILALVIALVSFGAMAQTAHLGGLIRHSELQQGSANAPSLPQPEQEEHDKD